MKLSVIGNAAQCSCTGAPAVQAEQSSAGSCRQRQEPRVILSVVIITHNEEANIGRTLASVQPLVADGKGEIIVVDSGSTDRTVEIAKSFGANVFIEEWKGYAAQKNSAIDKAAGDWILSLDADEELDPVLAQEIGGSYVQFANREEIDGNARQPDRDDRRSHANFGERGMLENALTANDRDLNGFRIPRKNYFSGGDQARGFWPDPKLRLFRRGNGADSKTALFTKTLTLAEGTSAVSARRPPPPLLPHPRRLHRPHEPLLVPRRGDGRRQRPSRLQRVQHRRAPARNLHLQLFFSPRIS